MRIKSRRPRGEAIEACRALSGDTCFRKYINGEIWTMVPMLSSNPMYALLGEGKYKEYWVKRMPRVPRKHFLDVKNGPLSFSEVAAELKEAYKYPTVYLEPTDDGMWFDKSIHGVIDR